MLGHFLSDELRIKTVRDVIRLSNDEVIFDEYEQMVGDALINYEDELRAREEGIKYNKNETIKILLENNVDYKISLRQVEKVLKK